MRYVSQLTKTLIPLCIGIAFFFNSVTYSKCTDKPIRIAVIDTGFGYEGHGAEAKLCPDGHKDFSDSQTYFPLFQRSPTVPIDTYGHGTNIVGIIESYLKPKHINYCIEIIKYADGKGSSNNLKNTIKAFRYVYNQGVKYINYSSGGRGFNQEEKNIVEKFLDANGTLVVAAGNDGKDLDVEKNYYYPAQYDTRIIVVGALDRDGSRASMSNYGSQVKRWEVGVDVEGYGVVQSGTSQATAVAMGKIVSNSSNTCEGNDDNRNKSNERKESR